MFKERNEEAEDKKYVKPQLQTKISKEDQSDVEPHSETDATSKEKKQPPSGSKYFEHFLNIAITI